MEAITASVIEKSLQFTPDDIPRMREILDSDSKLYITSNRFTGARIRFSYGGTAQLFFSGRVNFLGAKSTGHLTRMYQSVLMLSRIGRI